MWWLRRWWRRRGGQVFGSSPMTACAHLPIQLLGRSGALERSDKLAYVRRAGWLASWIGYHAEALSVVSELDATAPEAAAKRQYETNARMTVFDVGGDQPKRIHFVEKRRFRIWDLDLLSQHDSFSAASNVSGKIPPTGLP